MLTLRYKVLSNTKSNEQPTNLPVKKGDQDTDRSLHSIISPKWNHSVPSGMGAFNPGSIHKNGTFRATGMAVEDL